ncbi:hypothetical protein HMPREF9151_02374 [Hoylesella saccharolytica F0055]|uniref:Uncharacterized protein n=1 Tax=Hoylesella saccharolytica F0055 TaxID=1127699 RepID=L1MZN7_9BACT|nr:hypothetical protein HMPREF9151_02374 [Hoylesella saccharolytica F0055]
MWRFECDCKDKKKRADRQYLKIRKRKEITKRSDNRAIVFK